MEMAKTKVSIILLAALCLAACSRVPKEYAWEQFAMDGHRTGVSVPAADNAAEALGSVSGGTYTAPNGRVFKSGSTPKVAALLISVQPEMAALKEVVARSENGLFAARPESGLSNFIVDNLARDVERLSGRKVDVAISNFGGIRADISSGDVLLDDIQSMLPFNNRCTWLSVPGSEIRGVFEQMARKGPQCVSGAKVVVRDGKLESVLIGGKPLDDKRYYGLATIDFLVDGGDGYKLARGAREMIITDKTIGEVILEDVRALTAAGKSLDYGTDKRFIVYGKADLSTETIPEDDEIVPPAKPAPSSKARLSIIHCNDTHSHLDPVRTSSGLRGGIIERAAFVDSVRRADSPSKVLLLHAGDFNQGTSYYSQMHGVLEAKIVNALGYDCITLGNHELDDGIESLAGRLALIDCPIVCSNCDFPDTLQQYVKPYAILKRGGMKIGLIGLEANIATMVAAPIAERIAQRDNAESVNAWASFLKESERCDMVILLSHIGYDEDRALLPKICNVDLVIGGHSHTFVDDLLYVADSQGRQVPIITDGCWGINMGLVKVY